MPNPEYDAPPDDGLPPAELLPEIPEEPQTDGPPDMAPRGGSSKLPWILLIVAVFAAAGGNLFFMNKAQTAENERTAALKSAEEANGKVAALEAAKKELEGRVSTLESEKSAAEAKIAAAAATPPPDADTGKK